MFLPIGNKDQTTGRGTRSDGKNLIQEWLQDKKDKKARYVQNRKQLLDAQNDTDYVLGTITYFNEFFVTPKNSDSPQVSSARTTCRTTLTETPPPPHPWPR